MENKISFEKNSWGVIRLVCCVLIMFSHYCVHAFGETAIHPYKPFLFSGSSLVVFFFLSGFLIGPSVLRNTWRDYILKRVIRLYPVYVVTLIATLIVADIAGADFGLWQKIKWFVVSLFMQGAEYGGISNGAIWAIFIQIQVYLIAVLLYKHLHKIESVKWWSLIILFFLICNITYLPFCDFLDYYGLHKLKIIYCKSFIPYLYIFLLGMFVYRFFYRVVPFLKKYALVLLAIHLIWHIGLIEFPHTYCYTDPISVITVSMAATGLAYRIPDLTISKDMSYDIFCWHMPVWTAVVLFSDISGWIKISICIIITVLLSFVTNRFVEQRLFHK